VSVLNPLDIFLMSTQGVKERKLRFALNLVGILIGCAAVTGLISVTQGLTDNVTGQLDVFGPTNIIIIPGDIGGGAGAGFLSGTLGWRDLGIVQRTPGVEAATPIVTNQYCQFTVRGREYFTDVYGVTEAYAEINKNTVLAQGRNFVRGESAVVVLGAQVAWPLDSDEEIINLGDRIKVTSRVNGVDKEMTLRVIGILKEQGSSFGFNLDTSISIPLSTAQQFFEVGGGYNFIIAKAASIDEVGKAVASIEDELGDRATVISYASAQQQVGAVLGTIQSVLAGIAGISLLVAGVGIINTMTVSVMERTREIGTLKAVGAKSVDVLFIFLSEAFITGLVGGTIGAVFGFVLGQVVGRYISLAVQPSLSLGMFVVGFAVVTSILSGLYPAWRASSLNPVEALRHE
jgi:putative ABC transport system permease protein